jgi:NAD(P)-dependent dehydrogenase (short-subunit alcohol dehydrogenase family)
MLDPLDFRGRRAVVTGAASGIGRATAELLRERGASVVAADLSQDALRELAAAGIETVVCDVTRADHRDALVAAAGACHHLVNAAGAIRLVPLDEVSEDDWEAVMAVNAKALFFLCQAFARVLSADGSIVNVSSVAAKSAATLEVSVYAASKAAVLSITRSFAYAHSPRGLRVNAVLPGIVDTPMQDSVLREAARIRGTTPESLHEARLRSVPLGRSAPPRECAEAIVFLLSPAASYITGQAINVDGGYLMY